MRAGYIMRPMSIARADAPIYDRFSKSSNGWHCTVAISKDGRYAALGVSLPAKVYVWRLPDAK